MPQSSSLWCKSVNLKFGIGLPEQSPSVVQVECASDIATNHSGYCVVRYRRECPRSERRRLEVLRHYFPAKTAEDDGGANCSRVRISSTLVLVELLAADAIRMRPPAVTAS